MPFPFTPHQQIADEAATTIPPAKPLIITDLPNEILLNIMACLSGGTQWRDINKTMWDFSTSKADTKNVRLSCRDLSNIASKHFFDHVSVVLSQSSITNFERISNHPHISNCVKAVQISLALYDDAIGSLEEFARYHVDNLALPHEDSEETRAKAALISQTWDRYLETRQSQNDIFLPNFDHEQLGYIHALVQGYYGYQQRLREQEIVVQASGRAGFTVRLAHAMAKLPLAKHLEVTDWDTIHWGPRSRYPLRRLDISGQESLVNSLSQWRNPFDMIQGTKHLSLVPSSISIGTLRPPETGPGITSLNIQISPSRHTYAQLSLLYLQEDQLRSSLRDLRSFRFESWDQSPPNLALDPQGFQAFARFLDACTGSEHLECLVIDPNLAFSSGESLIRLRPWPKLKYAVLKRLPASESNLEALTAPIASQEGCLIMDHVHLCGGTWAGVLDMLRKRRIRVSLGLQNGAECDTRPDEGMGVFCRNRGLPSFAEYYVRGDDMPNPMLEALSEELQEELFGLPSSHQGGLETFDQDF